MTAQISTLLTGAADAALVEAPVDVFDRYLLIDDTDEFDPDIQLIVRECNPRAQEVHS